MKQQYYEMNDLPTTPRIEITTIEEKNIKSITSIETLIKDVVFHRENIILNHAYLRDALATTIVNILQWGNKETFINDAIEYATDYKNGQFYNIDYVGRVMYDYSLCADMYGLIKVMRNLCYQWADLGYIQSLLTYDIVAYTIAKFYDKDSNDIEFMLRVGTEYQF